MLCAEDRIDKGSFSSASESQCGMIHNDHLGAPQKITDASGTVVWAADYKPFGEVNVTTNTITNNLRFPGQYFDTETGLDYNYFRDYNPAIGRYIEADRIGIRRGNNHLYTYAKSSPQVYVDKLGSLPNFGGGAFGVAGILAGGFSVEYEECCKGTTKYARTLWKLMYGLGIGLDGHIASGGGSNGVQIFGPSGECQDYSFDRPEQISCLTASYYLGVDACQNNGNQSFVPNTMNGNIGMGAAAYSVKVHTYISKEVPIGCCSKKQ